MLEEIEKDKGRDYDYLLLVLWSFLISSDLMYILSSLSTHSVIENVIAFLSVVCLCFYVVMRYVFKRANVLLRASGIVSIIYLGVYFFT